jgi:drug/metabolite transporter (DMT)-like permease
VTGGRIVALTTAALVGFAANSLLCRAALGDGSIDAASFTTIRIAAGAITLALLARVPLLRGPGSWASAGALFAYAAAFSFAYLRLTTATGALVLFAMVQATMIGVSVARGDRPRALEWVGLALAAGGLVALTAPGLEAPDPLGAGLMATAGIAWGVYSLRAQGAKRRPYDDPGAHKTANPLAVTADNFARSVPLAAVLLAIAVPLDGGHATGRGAVLAIASGAIASGIGYSLWYAALPHLAAARAAIVQLSVPVLAAAGGVIALGEVVTLRLAGAAAAILGGVAIALVARRRAKA